MKKLFLTLLLFIPYISSTAQDELVITGKVYNPGDKTIKFLVNNLFKEDREIHTKRLDKNGEFIVRYKQFYPHDNYISYNNKLFTYFAAPGDSLHFEIKNDSISFSADHSTLNNELQIFRIRGKYDLAFKVNSAQERMEPLAYKKKILNIQAETDSLLQAYRATSQVLAVHVFSGCKSETYD